MRQLLRKRLLLAARPNGCFQLTSRGTAPRNAARARLRLDSWRKSATRSSWRTAQSTAHARRRRRWRRRWGRCDEVATAIGSGRHSRGRRRRAGAGGRAAGGAAGGGDLHPPRRRPDASALRLRASPHRPSRPAVQNRPTGRCRRRCPGPRRRRRRFCRQPS